MKSRRLYCTARVFLWLREDGMLLLAEYPIISTMTEPWLVGGTSAIRGGTTLGAMGRLFRDGNM